jgi:predicted GNAT family acetyltransferase
VVYVLDHHQPQMRRHDMSIRRLHAGDTAHVAQLSPDLAWIAKTWGGAAGLAGSGYAWGALVHAQLAAVACSFFVGSGFEEVGVVTEAAYRGQGLSVACADALCQDIERRAKQASWSTSPDNRASIRVAEKLGFRFARDDRLYVCGTEIPTPPRPPA